MVYCCKCKEDVRAELTRGNVIYPHRPDLFEKHELTKQDKKLLNELKQGEENPKWMAQALEKGKKFTK